MASRVLASRVLATKVAGGVRGGVLGVFRKRFHNGPPKNPDGENPWPYPQQKLFFWSGLGVFAFLMWGSVQIDLFQPKFGEIDWDKLRAERNALVDAAAAEAEEDEEDDEDDEDDDE